MGHGLDETVTAPLRSLSSQFSRSQMKRLRNAQMLDPVSLHVYKWLVPITAPEVVFRYGRTEAEAHGTFRQIARMVEAVIHDDPRFTRLYDVLAEFASQPVSDLHLVIANHWRLPGYTPVKSYLAVVYARALHVLRNGWFSLEESLPHVSSWLTGERVDLAIQHLQARLEELGPRFFSQLVLETECRAAEDPDFEDRLDRAILAFEEHAGPAGRALWSGPSAEQVSVLSSAEHRRGIGLFANIAFAFTLWD
ncbi:hypothetical protein [Nannocystis punicea]|uniref:Uncharacterized protein n=1 Tax=Nannocystis punicea TaxID=2995304 RepID=A0ABY7HC33_9BACT|nr:hypothetical protein [Nannocystis poenicansa]WAS96589.1 hypothetical protein O0S08_10565 [Nannocystis poenicansa]